MDNLDAACRLAWRSGVTTVLLTGKGEPTLFPEQVTEVLRHIRKFQFPIIELQTNGIWLADRKVKDSVIEDWFGYGLRIISISNVGIDPDLNRRIYTPNRQKPLDLAALVHDLHERRFSVRMATVMIKGGIDTVDRLQEMISWSQKHKIEQLTVRPVAAPLRRNVVNHSNGSGLPILDWINESAISKETLGRLNEWADKNGTLLLKLPYGMNVYDVDGQNVCITNCLTHTSDPEKMRQIIYFPDGHLRYSWEYAGAIIL